MKKPFLLSTVFILTVLFFLQAAIAQKDEKVSGTAQVKMESNMTEDDTRKLAEELAKINALQSAFGTITSQEFILMIKEGKADYNIIARTEIKGEWIETTNKRFSEDFKTEKKQYGNREIKWITCRIKGNARKLIPRAHIDFYPQNCPEKSCRTTEIVANGNLYLYFKSPVHGYLSVFLDDGNETSRLLPDNYTPIEFISGVEVNGDQDYLFFSPKYNSLPQKVVDEYILTAENKVEYNYLYVVFSRAPFVKPILKSKESKGGYAFPKSLSSDEFQEWLSDNKYAEDSFQIKQMAIKIKAQ